MSELYEKSLLKLELDQVLELLAQCAGSEGGREACRRLRPTSDLEEVELMLSQTTAASDLCTKKGNPVFGDVTDCSASLERADRGASSVSGRAAPSSSRPWNDQNCGPAGRAEAGRPR